MPDAHHLAIERTPRAATRLMPPVSLAAVIGRTDPKWGERPVLLVEMHDVSLTDEQLLAPLRGRVAPWWLPDDVVRLLLIRLCCG